MINKSQIFYFEVRNQEYQKINSNSKVSILIIKLPLFCLFFCLSHCLRFQFWYHITLCTRARAATEPTRLKESVDGGGVGGGAAAAAARQRLQAQASPSPFRDHMSSPTTLTWGADLTASQLEAINEMNGNYFLPTQPLLQSQNQLDYGL